MHPSVIIAVVAVAGLAISVAGGFGFVPGLSAACVPSCSNGLSPSFSYVSNGGTGALGVLVTDTSTITGSGVQVLATVLSWGDHTAISYGLYHGTVSHTYTAGGTYPISEGVQFLVCQNIILCIPYYAVAVANFTTGTFGTSLASVAAAYSYSVNGQTVSITDTSSYTGTPAVRQITVSWGDGSALATIARGGSLSHAYSSGGTYNVTENVFWSYAGISYQSTASNSIATGSGQGAVGFSLNSWGAALMFGSGALLATQAIPVTRNPAVSIALGGISAIIGYVVALVVVI